VTKTTFMEWCAVYNAVWTRLSRTEYTHSSFSALSALHSIAKELILGELNGAQLVQIQGGHGESLWEERYGKAN
jgi:hypothetical protein